MIYRYKVLLTYQIGKLFMCRNESHTQQKRITTFITIFLFGRVILWWIWSVVLMSWRNKTSDITFFICTIINCKANNIVCILYMYACVWVVSISVKHIFVTSRRRDKRKDYFKQNHSQMLRNIKEDKIVQCHSSTHISHSHTYTWIGSIVAD